MKPDPSPEHEPFPDPRGALSDEQEFARRVDDAIDLLESIRDARAQLAAIDDARRTRLLQAAGHVARPDPWAKRELARASKRRRRAEQRAADESVLARTGIREKRREAVFATPILPSRTPTRPPARAGDDIDRALAAVADENAPEPRSVAEARTCYVCKCKYRELHAFYDSLCHTCGELNYRKRTQSADLSGRVALITGSRVKIGYQAAIMLLRAGAHVIVTTRFPRDAAIRYAREQDFGDWQQRLQVHGLDLRHTPSVEVFARHLRATLPRLDFIINNACQTVRRPAGFYRHLMQAEHMALTELPEGAQTLLASYEAMRHDARARRLSGTQGATRDAIAASAPPSARAVGLHDPAALSQVALLDEDLDHGAHLFPEGELDADLQQIDLRESNSWRLGLSDVPAVELLEVQLVNAVAPFVLNARLKPLMLRRPTPRQAHRQRVGDGGSVLPQLQDRQAPAHEHGQGRAQHDDAHLGPRLRARRHPHEQRRHRLGHRRRRRRNRRAQDEGARLSSAARHRRRRRAHLRSDLRRLEHRQARLGSVPEGLRADRLVV